jgi:hypothetical protein
MDCKGDGKIEQHSLIERKCSSEEAQSLSIGRFKTATAARLNECSKIGNKRSIESTYRLAAKREYARLRHAERLPSKTGNIDGLGLCTSLGISSRNL